MKAKFAIIGRGFIFPRHRQAIESLGGEVFLTCDIDKDKGTSFTDWVEMFNDPIFDEITHVSICTPNYLHSIITREALRKGKKVLCEKPLSINGTEGLDGVKTVLQLRYHPELQKINKPKELQVTAKMFRDKEYWDSWKGNEVMSGGVLYNLGVHYIDLGIFLLGDSWEIMEVNKTDKKVVAIVRFGDSVANFHIEIVNSRDEQGRKLVADGKEIVLSNQDNLSYEDLHTEVYREFLAGRGIGIEESEKSLKLINAICKHNA